MNLTFTAPMGQDPYRIDAGVLNKELETALGGWCIGWSASHNACQAIVDLALEREGDAALVRQVVEAHIANTATREAAKAAQIQGDIDAVATAKVNAVVKYLVTHSPTECYNYVETNVTNLAQAKDMLANFAMALSVLARATLR